MYRISLFRLPNAIFELRIHLHLQHTAHLPYAVECAPTVADLELTPNGEYLVVSGTVRPCTVGGAYHGHAGPATFYTLNDKGTLMWTDQLCGRFGRSINVGLKPGTEVRAYIDSLFNF